MTSLVSGSAFGFSGPDWVGSNIMKDRNREDAQISFDRTAEFQERMANTSWQRGVTDMQAAGINPMLAIQQGGASSPTPQMALPHSSLVSGGGNTSKQYMTDPTQKLLSAQADKTDAEAAEIRARTPTHEQNIKESIQRIEDLKASVAERTASASRQYQQTENLKAEIPRIQEDINRIMQQANALVQGSFKDNAQEAEIRQRVKANLPALQKAHDELVIALQRIQQPGKELDADQRVSFMGILGSYIKAVLPFEGFIGALPIGRTNTTIHKRGKP